MEHDQGRGGEASQPQVFLDMSDLFHANEGHRNSRGGADKLERALGICFQLFKSLTYDCRQMARELALEDRSAAHDGDTEFPGSF